MAGYTTSRAGRVGSEEWGINNRMLVVDCHFKLEGVGCFYELRSKTWANKLIGDRMRTRVVFHLNAKATQLSLLFRREISQCKHDCEVAYLGNRSIERKAIMRGRVPIP